MLIFNQTTKKQLDAFIVDLPQGILIEGSKGAGLLTTAKYAAGTDVVAIVEPTDKEGVINHSKGTISVKRIRELYEQSRSKSIKKQIFIIDDADKMSAGAQNAFLKLLEEPNAQVAFILTSHSPEALLSTITSRVERIHILPINDEESRQLLITHKLPAAQLPQAMFVAAGKPAELVRMSADSSYFDAKVSIMSAAKTFLTGSKSDQLQVAFSYAADREKALQLLQSSIAIVSFTLKSNPTPGALRQANRLANAYDAIAANGNTKLYLVSIVL